MYHCFIAFKILEGLLAIRTHHYCLAGSAAKCTSYAGMITTTMWAGNGS